MEVHTLGEEGASFSPALREQLDNKLNRVERRFGDRITRVDVFLKDVNADKGGVDKSCALEAHVAGLDAVAVTAQAEDAYKAIHSGAQKLEKAIAKRLGQAEAR